MAHPNEVPRNVLMMAVSLIKSWHDMPEMEVNHNLFKIYYENAPEMKEIRRVLGPYDEVKDEVISATSRES